MPQGLLPSTDEIGRLYQSGELLASVALYNKFAGGESGEQFVASCIALHNSGEIDLLGVPSRPEFSYLDAIKSLNAQYFYCEAIPRLHADAAALMECCQILAGKKGTGQLLAVVADEKDTRVPADARLCLQMLAAQLTVVKEEILENDRRVRVSARATELGRRLMQVPGVAPLLASAFIATVADPASFKTGRDLAAWIGLVPKQNPSGGKDRLGSITRAGNRYLRQMLVVGAMAVIRYAERHGTRRPWLVQLMQRRPAKVAAVALANKTARIIWALMTSGERYREPVAANVMAA